ncbi:MAG: ATP-binding protein [Patescibacteria group bacterium]
MLKRHYQNLGKFLKDNKINIIYGPRQVGKTTLIQSYLQSLKGVKYLNKTGDELDLVHIFEELSINTFRRLTSGIDLLIIDEAQLLPNIGRGLKIIKDHIPRLKVIVTGSASFDLVNKLGEPLTGRDNILYMYPMAHLELLDEFPKYELSQKLNDYLIFGSYPEIFSYKSDQEKQDYLLRLVNSYLIKDVLALEKLKGSQVILDLLRLMAFQIGQEVSTTELGGKLGLDHKTVIRYLNLLEKSFVLMQIRGFSRNLRKEIVKSKRYYFYDNGIRNALIRNFNELNFRDDIGMLWENFLVAERIKKQQYKKFGANNYFWRTYSQKEIDWIEEAGGEINAFEFKWSKAQVKIPIDFKEAYPNSKFQIINRDNYFEFII